MATIRKISFFFFLFLLSGFYLPLYADNPVAIQGVLDLRNWNFSEQGTVRLKGQWKFYWNQFIDPAATEKENSEAYLYEVPSSWSSIQFKNGDHPANGYATARLKILLPAKNLNLALHDSEISTAYRLYINGSFVTGRGKIGKVKEDTLPSWGQRATPFKVDTSEAILVIHISNFHHARSGIIGDLTLGSRAQIKDMTRFNLGLNMFVFGTILVIGLYHLVIFWLRKDEKTALYFALFCGIIALRSLTTGELFIMELFPDINWNILVKLEYLSIYYAVPLFYLYVRETLPEVVSKRALQINTLVFGLLSIIVLFTAPLFFSRTIDIFQISVLLSGVYLFWKVLLAVFHKIPGARSFLAGFILLFFGTVMEILYVQEVIDTGYVLPFTLFGFIFIQANIISKKFSNAFQLLESRSQELLTTNKAYENEIHERKKLETDLIESNEVLIRSRLGIIMGLAKLAEYRDEDTGLHLERMREYSRMLTIEMAKQPKYREYITDSYIDDIFNSAILHDIGKVGVPDQVLLKPGKLTNEEFDIIKTHTTIGGDSIDSIEKKINVHSFLTLGRQIAYYHHEKWNGTGYPEGLKEEEIPLSARIVAVADVYDALTSERPYKKPFSHEKAVSIITGDKGTHFAPDVVDAFELIKDDFDKIRTRFLG